MGPRCRRRARREAPREKGSVILPATMTLPLGLRIAAIACLGLFGLGALNWATWEVSIFGLSQEQMLILSFVPAGIVSYYVLAWLEGAGRNA